MMVAAMLLWAVPAPGATQMPGPEAAEAAATELVAAMTAADWAGMAERMHPAALRELRELLEPMFRIPEMTELREQVLGVSTVQAMAQLPDGAFFAGLMRMSLMRDPLAGSILETASYSPVGVVMEGDTAHVVGRMVMKPEGIPITKMEVSSFLVHDGRWLALLSGDLSAIAAVLSTMAQVDRDPYKP